MAEYASKGLGVTGATLGGVALGLGLLGNGVLGGCGGGLLGGNCGGARGAISVGNIEYVSELQAKVQGLEAEKTANANLVAAFNQSVANDKELRAEMYAFIKPLAEEAADNRVNIAKLEAELKCCCEKQELREQILKGDIDKVALMANNGLTALQGTVNCLQASVAGITKTIVPSSAICPQPMPMYNSWTAPTATAPTNVTLTNPAVAITA